MLTAVLCCSLLLSGAGFAAEQQTDSGLLWLVNYTHPVPSGYVPASMYVVANGQKLRSDAAAAYEAMCGDMARAGCAASLKSGYRSYSTQTGLFNNRLAQRQSKGMNYQTAYDSTRLYTAVPGTSEHQLGLAADISNNGTLTEAFAGTAAGRWLRENSWRYGFILRYEAEKSAYTEIASEPWHFRYVGMPHSQIMWEHGWCLEEYITYLQTNAYAALAAGDDMLYEVFWSAEAPAGYTDVIDVSADNAGGYITTIYHTKNMLQKAAGHWSEPALHQLIDGRALPWLGVIDPDAPITRGEFAVLYAALLPENSTGTFADVTGGDPRRAAVATVSNAHVMNGTGTGFDPDRRITREEAAVSVARSLAGQATQYIHFSDVASIAGWAFQDIQKLVSQQIITDSTEAFRPKDAVTWGEAAQLLARLQAAGVSAGA